MLVGDLVGPESVLAQTKPGDVNRDGKVDKADLDLVTADISAKRTGCDLPTDVNGDCKVDILDYNIVVANQDPTPTPTGTATSTNTPTFTPTRTLTPTATFTYDDTKGQPTLWVDGSVAEITRRENGSVADGAWDSTATTLELGCGERGNAISGEMQDVRISNVVRSVAPPHARSPDVFVRQHW